MRRVAARAGLVVGTAFITTIVVLITLEPAAGEATPDSLARALQRAIAEQDRDQMTQLVHNLPEDDQALDTLLDPPGCTSDTPSVQATAPAGGRVQLVLRDGGATCAWLPAAEHDGRWLIDPWAQPFHQP